MSDLALEVREGLPDALRVLAAEYPRNSWVDDPGFDGLIRFWLDRHVMFRRLLSEMRTGTEALIDHRLQPTRYAAMLSRYGDMFVNGLHEHHTIEDTYYFPKLAEREARIAHGFDILDRDHNAIDGYLASFVDGANAVLNQRDNRDLMQTDAGSFLAELDVLERLLNRHLLDEEELIVPVILKHGSAGLG